MSVARPPVLMERRVIFWLFLVQSYRVQSSDPPVFVQKGKDVLLEVNNVPEKFDFFIWKFGKNSLILVSYSPGNKPAIGDDYTGRIDFSETNKHSVILKNLQETDSGVYNAQVITRKGQFTLVQHHIIVQDVVSPVMLEVNSVSNSSDSCNITLTCSAVDSHINSTFRCVNQKCVQDGGNQSMITKFNASLNVYLMNDLVICNHSNQVSSTENKMDIQHVCPQYAVPGPKRNHIIGPAVGGGVFVLVLIAAVSMHLHHKKSGYHKCCSWWWSGSRRFHHLQSGEASRRVPRSQWHCKQTFARQPVCTDRKGSSCLKLFERVSEIQLCCPLQSIQIQRHSFSVEVISGQCYNGGIKADSC